jgi:large subunit ribosomal protein L17
MRHLMHGRKLGRKTAHRKAMLANLAMALIDRERVVTTVPKAKEVRGVIERLITYAKQGSLHAMRLAARTVWERDLLTKLFKEIAPRFEDRQGGYVRILRTGIRKGDDASMCFIEFVVRPKSEPAATTADEGAEQKTAKRGDGKAAEAQRKPAKKAPPKASAGKDEDKGKKVPKKAK